MSGVFFSYYSPSVATFVSILINHGFFTELLTFYFSFPLSPRWNLVYFSLFLSLFFFFCFRLEFWVSDAFLIYHYFLLNNILFPSFRVMSYLSILRHWTYKSPFLLYSIMFQLTHSRFPNHCLTLDPKMFLYHLIFIPSQTSLVINPRTFIAYLPYLTWPYHKSHLYLTTLTFPLVS